MYEKRGSLHRFQSPLHYIHLVHSPVWSFSAVYCPSSCFSRPLPSSSHRPHLLLHWAGSSSSEREPNETRQPVEQNSGSHSHRFEARECSALVWNQAQCYSKFSACYTENCFTGMTTHTLRNSWLLKTGLEGSVLVWSSSRRILRQCDRHTEHLKAACIFWAVTYLWAIELKWRM